MRMLTPNIFLDNTIMLRASDRFTAAFAVMWPRIPEQDRITLGAFFEQKPCFIHLCFCMDFDIRHDEPWGRCAPCGDRMILTFLAPFIERADNDEAVIGIIAHEFAHCHNHATGRHNPDDQIEEERNARALNASWGFEDSVGYTSEWKAAIDQWRTHRALAFGQFTEKRLFGIA